ncbi:phage tail spike protein [uncultured Clostridium sp.]|uniref:phage tail spike protein n=1 Tax=uncultured Clostridium sp. TaxID=59620 RepID=UPI0025ED9BFC|nr:phage tail spike protein [uncultured Clostridium sp.]
MINLYEKNEINFKHNAYVLNEAIKAEIEEEINTSFDLDFSYPVNDSKGISNLLVPGSIIKVPVWDKRESQLFVIRRSKPSLDNLNVNVFAQHILTCKLDNNVVLDTNIVNKTRKEAVLQILNSTINKHNFIVGNKDINTSVNNLRIVRYSPLEALIGDKNNTIINRYGGEIIFDNFNVNIIDSIGENRGIQVSYAKNITGATMTLEDTDLITEIIPLGKDGLMIPEKSIRANNFDPNNPFTRVVEFSSIGVVDPETDENGNITNSDEIVTKEQAYELLRQACLDKFNKEHVNQINFNLDLNFIELCDCIDFDGNDYSELNSRVTIGDIINVNIKPFGIFEEGRIYKLKRDAITGKLISCEIGYKVKSLTDTINSTNNKIDDAKEELQENINKSNEATSNLKVIMEKRDSEIELSLTNEIENRKTEFKVLDGKIEERVTEDDFEAYRTTTAKEISQKISKGAEFSSEMKQNIDAFQFLFEEASGSKTEITRDGITVYKGGFKINDSNGNTIFWVNSDGVLRASHLWADDLTLDESSSETGSSLWNVLYNMSSITLAGELKIKKRLTINEDDFYISDSGDSGFSLSEYIERVVNNM